jgi:hypothetical protein
MQLVRWPKQFDVIVTDNLFGDMLSDIAAMLTGSLGMLPSASLGEVDAKTKKRKAMYEPVHGSAPDIAGKGVANPIAMLASFGMALRYSLTMAKEARPDRSGDCRRARAGTAHRRHQVGRRQDRDHRRNGRRGYRRDEETRDLMPALAGSSAREADAWQPGRRMLANDARGSGAIQSRGPPSARPRRIARRRR